jgi:hypothetical protein
VKPETIKTIKKGTGKGGARPGSGRKKGSVTRRTREIANACIESGLTPLEYMLQIMRDIRQQQPDRLRAAESAAPYIHPKLAAIQHSGDKDNPVQVQAEVIWTVVD